MADWIKQYQATTTWGSGVTSVRQSWNLSEATAGTSAVSRLNHIFPQAEDTSTGKVNFIWHIQSEGAFLCGTGNQVYIQSTISQGMR